MPDIAGEFVRHSSSPFQILLLSSGVYLQGQHPDHKGVSNPEFLGIVEGWFATIMHLPRLGLRIKCVLAARTFEDTAAMVGLVLILSLILYLAIGIQNVEISHLFWSLKTNTTYSLTGQEGIFWKAAALA